MPLSQTVTKLRRMRAFVITFAAAWLCLQASSSQAQHVPIGRALFAHHCSRCHGLPPALLYGVNVAAGEPASIAAALGRVRAMATLRERISDQDMRDIAAYLAQPDAAASRPLTATERLFDWAEWRYQTLLLPRTATTELLGYRVRHYRTAGLYLGVADGQVWLYDDTHPARGVQALGSLAHFLEQAAADGF